MINLEHLQNLIDEYHTFQETHEVERWQMRVQSYLFYAGLKEEFKEFNGYHSYVENPFDQAAGQLGFLEALYHSHNEKIIENTTTQLIPTDIKSLINIIATGVPKSVQPLKKRRKGLPSLSFDNEYDYQDLVHSALLPWFKDIRLEEFTPSHAGTSKRVDIFLRCHDTFIEIKYARDKSHAKKLGDEISIDIHHYQSHDGCKSLIVLIFDPNRHINNADGLVSDLSKVYQTNDNTLKVTTIVSS